MDKSWLIEAGRRAEETQTHCIARQFAAKLVFRWLAELFERRM